MGGISQARQVTFLPRDQEMITQTVWYSTLYIEDYGYQLREVNCASGNPALDQDINDIFVCMSFLLDCPECCLQGDPSVIRQFPGPVIVPDPYYGQAYVVFSTSREEPDPYGPLQGTLCPVVQECTDNRDPSGDYFPVEDCSRVWGNPPAVNGLARCQELGCPLIDQNGARNLRPYTTDVSMVCQPVAGDLDAVWCDKDTGVSPKPAFLGCKPLASVDACLGPYYQAKVSNPCFWDSAKTCYQYKLTTAFKNCTSSCVNKAQGFERYEKDMNCFFYGDAVCAGRVDVEGEPLPPGFANNCVVSQCEARLAWQTEEAGELDGYRATCGVIDAMDLSLYATDYQQDAGVCFDPGERGGGGCLDCFQLFFKELAWEQPPLAYDFVARSDQKVVVLSQLDSEAHYCWTNAIVPAGTADAQAACPAGSLDAGEMPNAYLYTMIKVFDITNSQDEDATTEFFPGQSAQGNIFRKSFTGAGSVSGATVVSNLEQGHKYRVRLYWYIPSVDGVILFANVSVASLTVMRSRE